MTSDGFDDTRRGDAGAFGVNYALRPHKFVDRRILVEVLTRFANYRSLHDHVYVGLGSFAMEDHKLMNGVFGTEPLISLEIDPDVLSRQQFNVPISSIKPTPYSTKDFIERRHVVLRKASAPPDSNVIVWFDMTDAEPIRTNLDDFRSLLRTSEVGDIVRFTVDVDGKTFGRVEGGEIFEDLDAKRFNSLREQLGSQLRPGARVRDISSRLGISRLALFAFRLMAEDAFTRSPHTFEPLSLTTYADGHRMLSVTGAILDREDVANCRSRLDLATIPGGSVDWDDLIDIRIPQLTVWEKLQLDRRIFKDSPRRIAADWKFKLHDSISTEELLRGYKAFQRFYPTFRHVAL